MMNDHSLSTALSSSPQVYRDVFLPVSRDKVNRDMKTVDLRNVEPVLHRSSLPMNHLIIQPNVFQRPFLMNYRKRTTGENRRLSKL